MGILPASIKILHIDSLAYNYPLERLPSSLVELDLSASFKFQQPLGILPSTLKKITLNTRYTQPLENLSHDAVVVYIYIPKNTGLN
jgi:hypothetical protein